MISFRSNIITNLFLIKDVIQYGIFVVNGYVKTKYNFTIKPHDFVQINYKYLELVKYDYLLRFKNKVIL